MSVRVYVTGRIHIEHAGRLIAESRFPARQGRTLFAYLICHRQRPTTRTELADVLWPEALPAAWEAALNAIVSKLRTLLKRTGPSGMTLTSAFGAYVLQVGDDTWIDREGAAEAIDEAEGLLHLGRWRDAWGPANVAAITARQPFLPGEEGDWINDERARQHVILLRALDCLSEIWLLNGEPSVALGAAREIVALEPYREEASRRLMRVHVALGNRAEALRVYERCRELLAKELRTAPSPETQKAYQDVRGRDARSD